MLGVHLEVGLQGSGSHGFGLDTEGAEAGQQWGVGVLARDTHREPSALYCWILEILYCNPKGRRTLLRTPSTEGRSVCLCWAKSKPKGPKEAGLWRDGPRITGVPRRLWVDRAQREVARSLRVLHVTRCTQSLQGYLTNKKTHPPRTLLQAYAQGPWGVPGKS